MGQHIRSHILVVPVLILMSFAFCHQAPVSPLSMDEAFHVSLGGRVSTARSLASGETGNTNATAGVLQTFRRGVTMDPYGILESWNTTALPDFCEWAGVSCTRAGEVLALNLPDLGLEGKISPSLGSLVSLVSLNLSGNDFTGRIPSSLGSLGELRYLELSNNGLSGSIPVDISNCTMLRQISISNNQLSGEIPRQLGKLREILVIDLSGNVLSNSIPSSLGNCSSLQQLRLEFNNLSGFIPGELGKHGNLSILNLQQNQLVGHIPESLVNCSSLEILNLLNNSLTGRILPELSLLGRLTNLHLALNCFDGSIPETFGNLSSLRSLKIGGCLDAPLAGSIPSELGHLENLNWFEVYDSVISGSIPPDLGNLTKVEHFFLRRNRLTGTIPESLENLQNANQLDVGVNLLSGTIPLSLGNLRKVQWLDLQWNFLTGQLPPTFKNLSNIFHLSLSQNMLSGPLLPELGNFTTLRELSLDANAFTGELPSTFTNLNLLDAHLNNNLLSGAIPPGFFFAMANAEECDLSHNHFSGNISPWIGDMIMLQYLNLSYNMLSGTIPESIERCKSLNSLVLSNNNFTGKLPVDALQNLSLTVFSVANNSLEGPVPLPMGSFAQFTSSAYTGNPRLCGPPLEIKCSIAQDSCSTISPTCHQGVFYGLTIAGSVWLFGTLIIVCTICRRKILQVQQCLCAVHWHGAQCEAEGITDITLFKNVLGFKRKWTIADLQQATDGFSTANIIGAGGESKVFKATFPDEVIAVKVYHPGLSETVSTHQLYNEVKVLAKIRHRNLVSLYGFCAKPDLKALLVEYVANGDLTSHLYPGGRHARERCELDLNTRLQIAVGVVNALFYLHHECLVPVIHRDLKPANILLEHDFNPRVSDFGTSKLVKQGNINVASASHLCGTVGYIPPEYAGTSRVSTEGDVYSFGMVLLELLTGKHPIADFIANSDTLVSWVSKAWPGRIGDVLDEALIGELRSHEEKIRLLLGIGLICTRENPRNRPTMRDVQALFRQVWL